MIDLTPLDVRNKRGDFRRGMRGYESHEVDAFLEVVAERLEAVVRENLAYEERLRELQIRVERQDSRENAVQEALVSAQSLREEIREQALREADFRIREAEQEAERRIGDAERRVEEVSAEAGRIIAEARREFEELQRSRARFLRTYRALIEKELDLVTMEEARPLGADLDLDALRVFRRGPRGLVMSAALDRDPSPETEASPSDEPKAALVDSLTAAEGAHDEDSVDKVDGSIEPAASVDADDVDGVEIDTRP